MPGYPYVAKDEKGHRVEGVGEAESPNVLVAMLRSQGLTVVKVGRPKRIKTSSSRSHGIFSARKKRVSVGDLATMCRQLTTLSESGIQILDALEILIEQAQNVTLQEVLEQAREDVKGGSDFSDALAKHPKVFSTLFISMIQAGEKSSEMSKVMSQLASYLEAEDDLKKKIKSATTYPAFIMGFFVAALFGIVFLLVPKFEKIFSDFDMELPLLTRVLIGVSDFALSNILFELGALGIFLVLVLRWARSLSGRYTIDRQKLRIPIFGEIIRKASVARLSQTLATLFESGVPVADALEIAGKTSGNLVIAQMLDGVRMGVIGGSSIASQMRKRPVFPKMMVGMVSAGEESGELASMLSKLADSYSRDVDTAISGITSIMEPIIIVALGGVMMVAVLAIYLPIFKMSTGIH